MRIILVADTFSPNRTSAAVQLRDLAREFVRHGHKLTILLPSHSLGENHSISIKEGYTLLYLKSPRTKDVGNLKRAISEGLMPIFMWKNLRKSYVVNERWDLLVWYSPSIFHGPFVNVLKKKFKCKTYLIVRDIFPDWAADLGLMRRGILFKFFKFVAQYQYSIADKIGVQSQGNLTYFLDSQSNIEKKVEILPNWLGKAGTKRSKIKVNQTKLSGRKILVYAGNIGVAQSVDIFLKLAVKLVERKDLGFLFVGRGSCMENLKHFAQQNLLENVIFFDEIDPEEISHLLAQCHIGLVALSNKHKSHNIPGKFLTYLQNGLPVLANVNPGNDIAEFMRVQNVGHVCETNDLNDLQKELDILLNKLSKDHHFSERCHQTFNDFFSVQTVVNQILY